MGKQNTARLKAVDLPNHKEGYLARGVDIPSYTDLFLRLKDAAFLLDSETFQVIDCNDAAERALGHATEKMIGRYFPDIVNVDDRGSVEKTLRVSRRRYYPMESEVRVSSPSAPTPSTLELMLTICNLLVRSGQSIIQIVAKDVTLERENQRKLEILSVQDPLTGLANRRKFMETLLAEHERFQRFEKVYSILFIDVDHFKNYNDLNGHAEGDLLLKGLSQVLRATSRKVDLVARLGGEEFVILCPETNSTQAMRLAERLRLAIDQFPFAHSKTQPLGRITVSIGVTEAHKNGGTGEDVLHSADAAMYEAKRGGRDQARVSSCSQSKGQSKP